MSERQTEAVQGGPLLQPSSCNQGSAWHACASAEIYIMRAVLKELGNTTFVNTHDGPAPACLERAMSEGHASAAKRMMSCGASPRKQGSTWASFLRASTTSFAPVTAALIHRLIRHEAILEVEKLAETVLAVHALGLPCHLCSECGSYVC